MTPARLLLAVLLAATPAWASAWAGGPDDAAVDACLARAEAAGTHGRSCIGIVADPCLDHGDPSTAGMVACYGREAEVWDARLNAAYRSAMASLPPATAQKLKAVQLSWIETRNLSCRFYDALHEGGTIARPLMADCTNRATAERYFYLKGIADDAAIR